MKQESKTISVRDGHGRYLQIKEAIWTVQLLPIFSIPRDSLLIRVQDLPLPSSTNPTDWICLSVSEPKNMVSHCTLDLISWKILLKTCRLKCLIRYDTIRWWMEHSNSSRFPPYLSTNPAVKLLTHFIYRLI